MASNLEINDVICELLSKSYLKSLHEHPQSDLALKIAVTPFLDVGAKFDW